MSEESRLEGKRVLLVDDEPDVLETLESLLSMCEIEKAASFDEAKEKLETRQFEMAILDIMGVDGYALLDIAIQRDVIAVMLTANALSVEDTVKSYKKGAATYVPKEEMANITVYLNDILEAKEESKSLWWRWLDRLGHFYDKKFGSEWKDSDKSFWDEIQF